MGYAMCVKTEKGKPRAEWTRDQAERLDGRTRHKGEGRKGGRKKVRAEREKTERTAGMGGHESRVRSRLTKEVSTMEVGVGDMVGSCSGDWSSSDDLTAGVKE